MALVSGALCAALLGAPCRSAAGPIGAPDLQPMVLSVAAEARPELEVRAPLSRWRRSAGPAALTAGGLLLAGGFTLSMVSRQMATDLRNRGAALPLGPDGVLAYRRLDRLNGAATGLCILGGVTATLGAWLWLTAPDLSTDFQPMRGGFLVQYRGRF
jgi:hypothetical protein